MTKTIPRSLRDNAALLVTLESLPDDLREALIHEIIAVTGLSEYELAVKCHGRAPALCKFISNTTKELPWDRAKSVWGPWKFTSLGLANTIHRGCFIDLCGISSTGAVLAWLLHIMGKGNMSVYGGPSNLYHLVDAFSDVLGLFRIRDAIRRGEIVQLEGAELARAYQRRLKEERGT